MAKYEVSYAVSGKRMPLLVVDDLNLAWPAVDAAEFHGRVVTIIDVEQQSEEEQPVIYKTGW